MLGYLSRIVFTFLEFVSAIILACFLLNLSRDSFFFLLSVFSILGMPCLELLKYHFLIDSRFHHWMIQQFGSLSFEALMQQLIRCMTAPEDTCSQGQSPCLIVFCSLKSYKIKGKTVEGCQFRLIGKIEHSWGKKSTVRENRAQLGKIEHS